MTQPQLLESGIDQAALQPVALGAISRPDAEEGLESITHGFQDLGPLDWLWPICCSKRRPGL